MYIYVCLLVHIFILSVKERGRTSRLFPTGRATAAVYNTVYNINATNRGQILLQLYTMSQNSDVLTPTDLGKELSNGNPLDCYLVS